MMGAMIGDIVGSVYLREVGFTGCTRDVSPSAPLQQ
jgi:hypothetical protein